MSKPSRFFRIISHFPESFKTIRIFSDHFPFTDSFTTIQIFQIISHILDGFTTIQIYPDLLYRGWAEQEPRICVPVPAVPVQNIWQEKSQRICNYLNWFRGVTFTFWIKMYRKNIFPKINSKNYKFSGSFPARYPVPALPRPEYKFLFPVPLNP